MVFSIVMAKYGIYVACVLLVAFTSFACAQVPIPDRPLGFQYGRRGQSKIQLDAFLDLTCPYSKTTFPVLLDVADHYGVGNLRLNVLIFPLPYHRAAWLAAQSTYIVDGMNPKVTFQWMADFFAAQETFFNDPTLNKSDSTIMSMIADVASNVVNRSIFLYKLKRRDVGDADARIMWKYSCSRTISGTPQYLLNGVRVDASSSWTVDDWKKVIDPLLGRRTIEKPFEGFNCTQGTTSCEYLPGKVQCCTAGENCIPNVGCRC